jgi:hypothetical protein
MPASETAIIKKMNETNTSTQGGRDLQSLQPQGSQTQQTTGGLQAGVNSSISSSGNTSNVLNQALNSADLKVGLASANSQTSVAPPELIATKDLGVSGVYIFIPLFLFFLVLLLAYKRSREVAQTSFEGGSPNKELPDETTRVKKTKKKRKKLKRPHHH